MTQPKYQHGDTVYFLNNGAINSGKIYSGSASWTAFEKMYIHYYLILNNKIHDEKPFKEEILFESIEKLKENL